MDVDTLTFAAGGLPDGLTINERTGLISGTITAAPGLYEVIVLIDDTFNLIEELYFNWIVVDPALPPNEAPIADAGSDIVVFDSDGNGSEIVTLDGSGSSDDAGYIDWYQWHNTLDDVISNDPAVEVTVNTNTTQIFTLTVFDEYGEYSVDSVSVTVTSNPAPVVTPIAEQTTTTSTPVQLQVIATDTQVLSYASSGLPAGLSINSATGLISGTVTATPGTYPVIIQVSDGITPIQISFNWIVTAPQEVILNFSLVDADLNQVIPAFNPIYEGATLNLAQLPANLSIIANTSLPGINTGIEFNLNNGTVIAQANQTPYILSNFSNTGLLASTGAHTLTAANSNSSLTLNFTVINNYAPLANAGLDINLNDTDANGLETVTLNGSASTDDSAITAYEWRVSGSSTIIANTATADVTVSTGTTIFELTVYDAQGEYHSDTVNVTLTQPVLNTPPVITGIAQQTNITGTSVNLQVIASDTDPLRYSASGLPAGLSIDPVSGLISGTITAPAGTYPVTVSALDIANPAVSLSFNWIITGTPQPEILSFSLFDTATGTAIPGFNPIPDGATLNLATLPANLTIVLNTNPATLSNGINLNLNNGGIVRQETTAPYSLAGNTGGIFNPVTLPAGANTLVASTNTDTLTLTFTVLSN